MTWSFIKIQFRGFSLIVCLVSMLPASKPSELWTQVKRCKPPIFRTTNHWTGVSFQLCSNLFSRTLTRPKLVLPPPHPPPHYWRGAVSVSSFIRKDFWRFPRLLPPPTSSVFRPHGLA